jgi:hypothetical protein
VAAESQPKQLSRESAKGAGTQAAFLQSGQRHRHRHRQSKSKRDHAYYREQEQERRARARAREPDTLREHMHIINSDTVVEKRDRHSLDGDCRHNLELRC